ncbi:MAG TPA: hypothetical protein VMK31_05065 [Sphingomicrobium sp.]|nr:hypothetical protein [Sphingomicrobium sp.]
MLHRLAAFALIAGLAAPVAAAPGHEPIRIPPELTDPEFVERITGMTEALSKALLNLPVGEIEAAAQGRPVTEQDRNRTLGDVGRISGQELERQVSEAKPQIEAAMQALSKSLPAMSKALSKMAEELERATANLPQPGYPRR